jgi:outer membrane receptor protein involved in Fe transport
MNRKVTAAAAVSIAGLLLGAALPAAAQQGRGQAGAPQSIASTTHYVPLDDRRSAPRADRTITLDLTRVSLADALDAVGRAAGVRVLYGEDVLTSRQRITVHVEGATLGRALATVLQNSGLEPLISESGESVLVKRSDARQRPQRMAGSIHGRVSDATTQRPLEGVMIEVVGTTRRTITSESGEYTITAVPAGTAKVRAARIGYAPVEQEVTVQDGGTATLNFALRQSAVSLDEVVVTATGEQRTREIATSVSTIGAKDFQNAPVSNPQDVLVGRSAGVTVMANGGAPGSGGTIRLRGVNSISQGNSPIIYVDGVRMYSDLVQAGYGGRQGYLPLNDISADDIDHIEVVKGAAATTLYGTEASGGVIQVFTKKGVAGQPVWNFNATGGFNHMGHIGPKSDPTGLFINKCRGPELVNSLGQPFVDVMCPASGTYLKAGPLQRYALSVSGGADRLSYFLSGNFNDVSGVLPTSWNKDGGLRTNLSFNPTPKLQVALSTAYQKRQTRWAGDGDNSEGLMLNASRADAGYFVGKGACAGYTGTATCVANGHVFEDQLYTYVDHFTGGLTLRHDASERISNRFTLGYDFNSNIHDTGIPWGYPSIPLGQLYHEDRKHTKVSLDYVGSLKNSFGGSLSSAFSWGGQLFRDFDRWTEVDAYNFAGPGKPTLKTAGTTEVYVDDQLTVVNAGFFLQEVLGWKERLFVTGGLRVDGNSAFGKDFGLQAYPKVSASYVLSSYDFWPAWWEAMKLRGAVGESGKAPGAFDAVRTWTVVPADSGRPGFVPGNVGNANLGPERTREIEFGFDASMLGGRLGLQATAYRATTYDALISLSAAPSEGFSSSQLVNAGTLQNSGVETQLSVGLLRRQNIDWTGRVNVSLLKSKALDLRGTEPSTFFRTYVKEGREIPEYYGAKVMNPNEFAAPVIEQDQPLGRQYPNRMVGLGTTLSLWNRLTLDVVGEGQYGGHLVNFTGYQNQVRGSWYPCYDVQKKLRASKAGDANALNDVTALDRVRCAQSTGSMYRDFWVEKTDFFKLRTASITYSLPREWLRGASSASITLAGRNLFTWTKYTGVDPEVQDLADAGMNALGRRDYYNFPNYKTFEMSVRVTY